MFKTTPGSYTGRGEQFVVDNLGGPLGWGIEIWGSTISAGSVNVLLYANGTNFIAVQTAPGSVTSGVASRVGMVYAGTGVASGITIYVNGVSLTTTVVSDTLAANTIASTHPVFIGSEVSAVNPYLGAIWRRGDIQ
jgi:hypothetical protein